ncbi:hypothetical protein H5410_023735 [Solanum commersonii]|uniref:Uncharacterized protein n=1 Tax=Solanum commersonii TaxID=4109 RepID=A0A9J5ZK59_SOLCO|nr:hypothetical protein H5410_023735 [Solanum commersonii]
MGASLAIALKCLFAILGCLVTGIVIYTIAIDGFSFVITPYSLSFLLILLGFHFCENEGFSFKKDSP